MPRTRKNHLPSPKAEVAIEAIRANRTTAQIAQMFGVHPTQVGGWKRQALAGLPDIFSNGREQNRQRADARGTVEQGVPGRHFSQATIRQCERGVEVRSGLLPPGETTIRMMVAPIPAPITIRLTASLLKYGWSGEAGCHNNVAKAHAEKR